MLNSLLGLDIALSRKIVELPHTLITDIFFLFFSFAGSFGAVWVALFLWYFYKAVKDDPSFALPFISAVLLSSFITNIVLKLYVQRPRPIFALPQSDILSYAHNILQHPFFKHFISAYPQDYAFPSGHATLAFSAATVLSAYEPKHRILFFVIAVLISFSRVYLGYHYLADILVGGFIGWATSFVILRLL